jgi:hypothetical protein
MIQGEKSRVWLDSDGALSAENAGMSYCTISMGIQEPSMVGHAKWSLQNYHRQVQRHARLVFELLYKKPKGDNLHYSVK